MFSFAFFILIMGNISLPLTSNFIGEFLILYGLYSANQIYGLLAGLVGIFVGTLYSVLLFNKVIFGLRKDTTSKMIDISWRELNILVPILIHIIWIGIYPNSFLDIINTYVLYTFF